MNASPGGQKVGPLPEAVIRKIARMPDPHPERRRQEYCWRSWPPVHTDSCGCLQDPAWLACFPEQVAKPEDPMERAQVMNVNVGTLWTVVLVLAVVAIAVVTVLAYVSG